MPPVMVAVAVPLHKPDPVALLLMVADAVPPEELFTITVFVAIHPLPSVTVTV